MGKVLGAAAAVAMLAGAANAKTVAVTADGCWT